MNELKRQREVFGESERRAPMVVAFFLGMFAMMFIQLILIVLQE